MRGAYRHVAYSGWINLLAVVHKEYSCHMRHSSALNNHVTKGYKAKDRIPLHLLRCEFRNRLVNIRQHFPLL